MTALSSAILAPGPVGYWNLSEGTGTATDAGSLANAGTYVGGTSQVAGVLTGETATLFNGTTGLVSIPWVAGYVDSDVMTVVAIVKRTATLATVQGVISKSNGDSYMRFDSTNKFEVLKSNVASIGTTATATVVNDSLWHLLVWTKSTTTNHIYLDGVNVDPTFANAALVSTTTPRELTIGCDNSQGTRTDFGALNIAHAAVYNVALTPTQITTIQNALSSVQPGTNLNDTFTRTVAAGGWGTADTGGPWTVVSGTTGAAFSTDGTKGIWTATDMNVDYRVQSAVSALGDYDLVSAVTASVLPVGQSTFVTWECRYQNTTNGYRARLRFNPDGTVQVEIFSVISGTETDISGVVLTTALSGYTANTKLRIRIRLQGSSIQMRVWLDGSGEPSTWILAGTSQSWTSGGVAVAFRHATSQTTHPVIYIDDLQTSAIAAATTAKRGALLGVSRGSGTNTVPSSTNRWWAADSPWNTPIGSTPVDPNSSIWMSWVQANSNGTLFINAQNWTPFVYSVLVGRDTGWAYHNSWGGNNTWELTGVPLNPNMVTPVSLQADNSDNHVYIIDEATDLVYNVFALPGQLSSGDWNSTAALGLGVGHLHSGSGFWDNGSDPITGAGGGSLDIGGMVYIEEIRSGRIPHALKCALPPAAHRGPSNWTDLHPTRVVLPATRSDGSAADTANAPPYGSRYQLDPTIDVTTLASDFDTQVVLKCLQEFGAYDTDNTGGGGMALYGSSPRSQVPGYPFRPGTPNGGNSTAFDKLISGVMSHLRIVQPVGSVTLENPASIGASRFLHF
jgi:hypothetical protein